MISGGEVNFNDIVGNPTGDNIKPEPKGVDVSQDLLEIKNQIGTLATAVSSIVEAQTRTAIKEPQAPAPATAGDVQLDPDVDRIISAKISNAIEKANKEIDNKSLTSKLDAKAEEEFPWLFNPKHPDYKVEYNNLLKEEYRSLINNKTPDAVYNAAARAQAKLVLAERRMKASSSVREFSARNASFGPGYVPAGGTPNTELTDAQKYLAAKLGVSEDVYKKHHGTGRRNG